MKYSTSAMPQLTRITSSKGWPLKRRWPYQAKVMKMLEPNSSAIGRRLGDIEGIGKFIGLVGGATHLAHIKGAGQRGCPWACRRLQTAVTSGFRNDHFGFSQETARLCRHCGDGRLRANGQRA